MTRTVRVSMKQGYKTYELDPTKMDKIESLFSHAKNTMVSPCAFHLIAHVIDPELFESTKKQGFIKEFKRALKREYKPASTRKVKSGRQQQCPDTLMVYSIEHKLTTQKEIDGKSDAYKYGYIKTLEQMPFLHIHIHIIADCNNTIPENFPYHAMKALNEIGGLRAARYAPTQNKKQKYKKLNTNYDDAVLRALYLAKIEQKGDEIPYRETFGTSRIEKLSKAS